MAIYQANTGVSYDDTFNSLDWVYENKVKIKGKMSEEQIYEYFDLFRTYLDNTINNILLVNKTNEKEEYIRKLCRYVIKNLLPICNQKIAYYNSRKNPKNNSGYMLSSQEMILFNNWLDMEDDLFAIASMRSLTHYALYLERDDPLDQKVWCYILNDVMGGIFYYANQMILNSKYQNLFKQCPTGYGKCVSKDTLIFTENGMKEIKDVVVGENVYSMDKNKLVLQKVLNKWESKKTQYKITTRSGKSIVVSPEHRLFTQKGYVQAKDLTKDDFLYSMLSKVELNNKIDDNELVFISLMLFEGSCTESFLSFTQEENDVYSKFKDVCKNLNFTFGESKKENNKAFTLWFHKRGGKVQNLLKKYELYGHTSHNKRLPKQFFTMPLEQKYKFIGYMLATDGYIPKYNRFDLIGISLASEKLIDDIQLLLSTCGIYSKKSYKKIKNNSKEFDSWRLEIPDEYAKIIYDNCYCYHKQQKLFDRQEIIDSKSVNCYCNRTNYPKIVLEHCKEFKKENNKQWKRNKSFKREIVEEFNTRTHLLDDVVYQDFYWDKIEKIEFSSNEIDMIDIEVENNHNFVANGLLSHNSKSDCNIICYILGYDPNASIMKVVGNPRLVGEMTENVVKMLQSPRHAKVFKQYAKEYEKMKDKDDIFTTLSKKDGLFKLKMSKKARTFLCVNKDTDIDGTRYDYQFFDDITQSKDRENVNRHMMDRDKFTGQWRKRASSEYEVRRFFTGTAYHIEDFLSYCKNYYSNQQPLIVDIDTIYFKWRKFCKLSKDKKSVYIMVQKLADLDLGEESCYCTFPQKYTKREALNMLRGSLGSVREFWAMEQQQPLPPETLAFDYAYLQTYSILPKDILEKRALTKMIIDPSRKGNDNFAGLIFKQSSIENTDKYYLTSCYYQKKSGKVALPNIADLIVEHKVDVIYIENNIDCVQLLEQELEKRKYFNYKIKEFYSYMKKDEKIAKYRDDIRDLIIFPIQRMYHFDSDMGRALKDITSYRLDGNNANDDSIDCCAMFCEQESENMENEVEIFDFDFSLR